MELPDDWYADNDGQSLILDPVKVAAEIERLRAAIGAAIQRLNESGTGEMGLLDTIHAAHTILRSAVEQSPTGKGE